MSVRRVVAVGIAVLFSLAPLVAQESLEAIPNWSAPPFWAPTKLVAVQKPEGPGLSPSAAEGVPTPPLAFTGITPCRIADTRGNGFTGQYGPPQITGAGRNIVIAGQCGIPMGAEAVSFNFHAANVTAAGFFVAYPAGGAFPSVAIMAYNQNTPVISNSAVVPLGTGGAITVVAGVTNIDLIIDTNGYYAPQTVVTTVNGLSGAVTLAAGSNVSITPSGQTLTIANTAPAAWSLTGNAGTTPGTHFLGTTDDQALELKVNNQRVMRLELSQSTSPPTPNVIGGFSGNSVTAGVYAATILGGAFVPNLVTDSGGTVGGGSNNRAGDNAGTTTDRLAATVGGGSNNTASGSFSTVPGGQFNTSSGAYSFAAGRRAKANHDGAFVWGDSTDADVASTGNNQFIVRASGGTTFFSNSILTTGVNLAAGGGSWSMLSDRQAKENVRPVDRRATLERLAGIPIQSWNYKSQDASIRHMGPMAQDFHEAFGLGEDNRHITTLDADGVALAAIQALYELVKKRDSEIEALEARLSKLETKEE